jgi:hypothetical protein
MPAQHSLMRPLRVRCWPKLCCDLVNSLSIVQTEQKASFLVLPVERATTKTEERCSYDTS